MYTTSSLNVYMNVKVTYSQVWWPILRIRALHLPIQGAHTQQWAHTRSSGQLFILRSPGSSWGFSGLLKGTSSWYWRWRESAVHSLPHRQSLPDRDSNSQHFDYESNYLPLGHDFPLNMHAIHNLLKYYYIIPYNVIDLTFHFQLDSFIRIHSGPEKCTNACSFGRYNFKILILPEVIWQTYECQTEGCKAISLKLRHSYNCFNPTWNVNCKMSFQ